MGTSEECILQFDWLNHVEQRRAALYPHWVPIWLFLSAAIGLANNPEVKPYVRNPGAAHCLYAKLLEKQPKELTNINQIKEQWQQCQDLIRLRLAEEQINTEEYQWLYEAQQQFKK